MSGKIKVGQTVWVLRVLKEGKMIEKTICEIVRRGEKIVSINLSKFYTMPDIHTVDDLVFEKDLAIKMCKGALKDKIKAAKAALGEFNSSNSRRPIPKVSKSCRAAGW